MIQKTYRCRRCGSTDIVKNGHNQSGNQQYHCKNCGAYGVLEPDKGYSKEEKERILRAYRERGSMRAVERIFGSAATRSPAGSRKGIARRGTNPWAPARRRRRRSRTR